MRLLTKSNTQFKKAITKLPLGVSSNFRYWGEEKTLYIKKGKGGSFFDFVEEKQLRKERLLHNIRY